MMAPPSLDRMYISVCPGHSIVCLQAYTSVCPDHSIVCLPAYAPVIRSYVYQRIPAYAPVIRSYVYQRNTIVCPGHSIVCLPAYTSVLVRCTFSYLYNGPVIRRSLILCEVSFMVVDVRPYTLQKGEIMHCASNTYL